MRSSVRRAVLILSGLAIAVPTLVAPASAAPVSTGGSSPQVQRLCNDPAPGSRACFAERVVGGRHPDAASPNALPSGYGPTQLRSAYNLPGTGGTGVTVAIVDAFDDPTAEADLGTYRSTYGLSACTTANGCFKKVSQTGSTTSLPARDTGWAGEIALDIDMVSAACPSCSILLVEATNANNTNLDTAVDYAAAHAQVVSNSYGGSESSTDTAENVHFNHPGVLILASSGDEGYVTEYPAASPTVLSVGGTKLSTASNSRGWTESAWDTSNTEGAGSGCSKYETKPSWQTDAGCAKRTVADVSAVADPATGVAVYDTTGGAGWNVYGGTSVASPLVGAIFALTGHASATGQFPYANPADFYDVTTGQTATSCTSYLCKAGTGYDGPTGVGTPNGSLMSTATAANDFIVSASTATVPQGGTGTSTISTKTTAGAAQSITLSVTGLPAGVTATISPATITSGGVTHMTVTATSAAAAGKYAPSIHAIGTSVNHTVALPLTITAATGGGGTCGTSSQLLTNPGFETATGWTATTGVLNTDGTHARTGSGYAWMDGYGSAHTDTLSQSVAIPAAACSATFTFWTNITTSETTTTAAYDTLTLAGNSTTLGTWSNLSKTSGWVQRTVDLSAFKGTTVKLLFTGTEDSSLATSFYLDDSAVTVTS